MLLEPTSPQVRWVLIGVAAALVASTAAVFALQRRHADRDHTELSLRIRTWWIICGLFGLAIVLDVRISIALLALVSLLALREYLTLVPTRVADLRAHMWAYACIPLQYYWAYTEWYGMFIIFIPVYLFLLLPARLIMTGQTDGFIRSVGTLHWGLMTTVFSLSHAAYLLMLEPVVEVGRLKPDWPKDAADLPPGPSLLLLLLLLTELNDIFQFLWGKAVGRTRIAPQVSPGKTLAGFVGGAATTVVVAAAAGPWLTFLDLPRAVLAGLIIAVSGFIGDLSISALKRDLGVKDSGNLLPGHGGILDRVDSLTYAAPLFFHFVYYCYC